MSTQPDRPIEAIELAARELRKVDPSAALSVLRTAGLKPSAALHALEAQKVWDSGDHQRARDLADTALAELELEGYPRNIGTGWRPHHVGANYPPPGPDTSTEWAAAALRRIIGRRIEENATNSIEAHSEHDRNWGFTADPVVQLLIHGVGTANRVLAGEIVRRFEKAGTRVSDGDPFHGVDDAALRCFAETLDLALKRGDTRLLDKMAKLIQDAGVTNREKLEDHVASAVIVLEIYPPSRAVAEVVERACEVHLLSGQVDNATQENVSAALKLWSEVAKREPEAAQHLRELAREVERRGFNTSVVSNSLAQSTDAGLGPEL